MEGTKEERRESGAPLLARCSGHSDPMFVSGEKRGSRAPESASNVTLWTQEDARGPESPLSMPTKTLQGKFDVPSVCAFSPQDTRLCDLRLRSAI